MSVTLRHETVCTPADRSTDCAASAQTNVAACPRCVTSYGVIPQMYTRAGLTNGKPAPAKRNSALWVTGSRSSDHRPANPTTPDEHLEPSLIGPPFPPRSLSPHPSRPRPLHCSMHRWIRSRSLRGRREAPGDHDAVVCDHHHTHGGIPVSYTHLRAHETDSYLVC